MPTAAEPDRLPHLAATTLATTRYLEALTVLDEADLRAPSLLPGWTRGHVAAHVARNADALTHALHGAVRGRDAWMYPSQQARDADIERDAGGSAARLHEDNAAAWERLLQAVDALRPAHLDRPVTRLPGDRVGFAARELGAMRRGEVEIHHADLDIGYTPADWPREFSLGLVARRQRELADGPSMVLRAADGEEVWKLGPGPGPEITGTAADLAWWLVGRGGGAGLHCAEGPLPELGRWR